MNESANILVVEDDTSVAQILASALRPEGYRVALCDRMEMRDRLLKDEDFDLLITDVGLADGDGLGDLKQLQAKYPELPIIVISAQNSLHTAVRATEVGAFEYFPKPFNLDELIDAVAQALTPKSENAPLVSGHDTGLPLVGRSPAMQQVYRMITRLLGNNLSVLILGESGTGKELVAEAIHNLGHRKQGPFVAVNMAAIPAELIESELFGHEKGAFTGATESKVGKFEQAQKGTLFLDEIGDMPMEAQTRLLRALQSGSINRVGGSADIVLDVRIIAATNKDFDQLIKDGAFREDLYYRINVVPIEIPPLRERSDDIPALCEHFLAEAEREGLPPKSISRAGMELLQANGWRGNVRELRNFLFRMSATVREDQLTDAILAPHLATLQQDESPKLEQLSFERDVRKLAKGFLHDPKVDKNLLGHGLKHFEKPFIEEILRHEHGNQLKTADRLGINRNTLRKKLTDYFIDPDAFKSS